MALFQAVVSFMSDILTAFLFVMVLVICVVVFLHQVLLNVAKEAPGCFLQHLQSLVQQVEQLWAAGQLREGEKVGALPAAAAVSNPRSACTHVYVS